MSSSLYTGRFAPSPTGPLHFGSLVCAAASFLHAKAHHGTWLLRIDDLDPPREQPGADKLICHTLKTHGLHWDGEVSYQSQHHSRYEKRLHDLMQQNLVYRCNCTRKRVAALQGQYDGHCRRQPPSDQDKCALRVKLHANTMIQLPDLISPTTKFDVALSFGDFIVKRKDGLFAYHLAAVTDDIDQHITHVIRGDDLLESTAAQAVLYDCFGHSPPLYGHFPVVKDERGFKLSKQHGAPGIEDSDRMHNLTRALHYLGIRLNFSDSKTPEDMLTQAVEYARQHPDFLRAHFSKSHFSKSHFSKSE